MPHANEWGANVDNTNTHNPVLTSVGAGFFS